MYLAGAASLTWQSKCAETVDSDDAPQAEWVCCLVASLGRPSRRARLMVGAAA